MNYSIFHPENRWN